MNILLQVMDERLLSSNVDQDDPWLQRRSVEYFLVVVIDEVHRVMSLKMKKSMRCRDSSIDECLLVTNEHRLVCQVLHQSFVSNVLV